MPAYELKGETVDRCEIEFNVNNMDVKNYNVRWTPFNHSIYDKIDRHADAFLFQTSAQAKVYQKIGNVIYNAAIYVGNLHRQGLR